MPGDGGSGKKGRKKRKKVQVRARQVASVAAMRVGHAAGVAWLPRAPVGAKHRATPVCTLYIQHHLNPR